MSSHEEIPTPRADIDIYEAVQRVFNTYPPLKHDRPRMTVTVEHGVVTASGTIRTGQSREVFAREVEKIEGVTHVDVSALHDDETIRIESGKIVPFGVFTSVSYSAVVLAGQLPPDTTLESLVQQLEAIPGVRTVIPNFQ